MSVELQNKTVAEQEKSARSKKSLFCANGVAARPIMSVLISLEKNALASRKSTKTRRLMN